MLYHKLKWPLHFNIEEKRPDVARLYYSPSFSPWHLQHKTWDGAQMFFQLAV